MSTTAVSKFAKLSSMTGAEVGTGYVGQPARHESAALTDACPHCLDATKPAFVIDQGRAHRRWRLAVYQCPTDRATWLCSWGRR